MSVAPRPLSAPCQPERTRISSVQTSQILAPQADLGRISQLPCIARVLEGQPQARVRMVSPLLGIIASWRFVVVGGEQILRVARGSDLAQRVDSLDAFAQALLQAVAEALARLARPSQLDGQLLAGRRLGLCVWDAVPRGDGERKHVALAVQTLDSPDAAQRQREAVASRPRAMCLPREAAGGARAGRVDEARALGGEAQVLLAQVQLADIVVALRTFAVCRGVAGAPRRMVGLQGELGGDLLEGFCVSGSRNW